MYKIKVYEDLGYKSIYDHNTNEEITTNETKVSGYYNKVVDDINNIVNSTKIKADVKLPNYLRTLMEDIEKFNLDMRSMKVAEKHRDYFKKVFDDFVDILTVMYKKYPILERSEDRFGRIMRFYLDTFIFSLYEVLPSYADPKDLEILE